MRLRDRARAARGARGPPELAIGIVDTRLGVDLLLPSREHGAQAVGDVGPLVCQIVPLADILPQVENEQMVGIDNQLPVAAADCAHAAVANVRPPVKRALDLRVRVLPESEKD